MLCMHFEYFSIESKLNKKILIFLILKHFLNINNLCIMYLYHNQVGSTHRRNHNIVSYTCKQYGPYE